MTNQSPESVIAEVIEYQADSIDTHGPGCYKNHAACLAVKLRDMLREPGVPDAALAAIERVRALHHETYANTSDEAWKRNQICAHCGYVFPCDTRAALDGAPEPEVKP